MKTLLLMSEYLRRMLLTKKMKFLKTELKLFLPSTGIGVDMVLIPRANAIAGICML